MLATLMQCFPLEGYWDLSGHAYCPVDDYKLFVGSALTNIITDVGLLVLPLPAIWSLRVSNGQKLMLSGVFTIGGLYA